MYRSPRRRCSGCTGSEVRSTFAARDSDDFESGEKGRSREREEDSSLKAFVQPLVVGEVGETCFWASLRRPPLGARPWSRRIFLSSSNALSSTSRESSSQQEERPRRRQRGVTAGRDREDADVWEVDRMDMEGDVNRSKSMVCGNVPEVDGQLLLLCWLLLLSDCLLLLLLLLLLCGFSVCNVGEM